MHAFTPSKRTTTVRNVLLKTNLHISGKLKHLCLLEGSEDPNHVLHDESVAPDCVVNLHFQQLPERLTSIFFMCGLLATLNYTIQAGRSFSTPRAKGIKTSHSLLHPFTSHSLITETQTAVCCSAVYDNDYTFPLAEPEQEIVFYQRPLEMSSLFMYTCIRKYIWVCLFVLMLEKLGRRWFSLFKKKKKTQEIRISTLSDDSGLSWSHFNTDSSQPAANEWWNSRMEYIVLCKQC